MRARPYFWTVLCGALVAPAMAAPGDFEAELIGPVVILPSRDIQIEDFSVSIPPGPHYLLEDDALDAQITLRTSVPHTYLGKPSFDATVRLQKLSLIGPNWVQTASIDVTTVRVEPGEVLFRDYPWLQLLVTKQFTVDLNAPVLRDWAFEALQDLGVTQWRFEVEVDAADEVHEGGGPNEETFNNFDAVAVQKWAPLSGDLHFGPTTASLLVVNAAVPGSCAAGQLELIVGTAAVWSPSSSGLWPDVHFPIDTLCTHLQADLLDKAYDLDTAAGGVVGPLAAYGTMGGLQTAVFFNLDAGGTTIGLVAARLPEHHSSHIDLGGYPHPRGINYLLFNVIEPLADPPDFANLVVRSNFPFFLHARALPFSLAVATTRLTRDDLTGTYARPWYAYDAPWNPRDQRALTRFGPRSNDRRFSKPRSPADLLDFSIDAAGLDVGAEFEKGTGNTHFPRARKGWGTFRVAVDGGRMVPDVLTAGSKSRFRVSSGCPGCGSGEDGSPLYNIQATGPDGIAADGAVTTPVTNLSNPAWGPLADDGGQPRNIFTKETDASHDGVFALPGYRALGTADPTRDVAHYLLGMRAVNAQGGGLLPTTHFDVDHSESRCPCGKGA